MDDIKNSFIVKSNFSFCPKIGVENAWLLIQEAEIPFLSGETKLAKIKILVDEGGIAESIAESMKTLGNFQAEFFEGSPTKYLHKLDLACEFIKCLPMRRSWHDKDMPATIDVLLRISR